MSSLRKLKITTDKYTNVYAESSFCLLLEKAGKEEAKERHQIVVDVLYHLFDEEDAPEWKKYLDDFLIKNKV